MIELNYTFLTTVVVPILGTILSNLMYFSPAKAVRIAQENGALGHLNPLPYPLAVVNCTVWMLYALASRDPYVFSASILGLVCSMHFTLVTYPLCCRETQQQTQRLLQFGLAGSFIVAAVAQMVLDGNKDCLGIAANIVLFFYYSGPLTTLAKVVRTRNSSYFDVNLGVAAAVNTSFWTVYGLAISDYFIV
jgi:solute carrier family 50 protein (sugar transporter)